MQKRCVKRRRPNESALKRAVPALRAARHGVAETECAPSCAGSNTVAPHGEREVAVGAPACNARWTRLTSPLARASRNVSLAQRQWQQRTGFTRPAATASLRARGLRQRHSYRKKRAQKNKTN